MESTATGVFNAAWGKRITIDDLATTIMRLCRKEMDIVYEAARPGDIKHSLADSSKAHAAFGYTPEYDITKGLKETLPWYQK
jgi:UDP-glucose 4-epimerase